MHAYTNTSYNIHVQSCTDVYWLKCILHVRTCRYVHVCNTLYIYSINTLLYAWQHFLADTTAVENSHQECSNALYTCIKRMALYGLQTITLHYKDVPGLTVAKHHVICSHAMVRHQTYSITSTVFTTHDTIHVTQPCKVAMVLNQYIPYTSRYLHT